MLLEYIIWNLIFFELLIYPRKDSSYLYVDLWDVLSHVAEGHLQLQQQLWWEMGLLKRQFLCRSWNHRKASCLCQHNALQRASISDTAITEWGAGKPYPKCHQWPLGELQKPVHLHTKMLNVFRLPFSRSTIPSAYLHTNNTGCRQTGQSVGLPSVLHPSVESWDKFSPQIHLKQCVPVLRDHLSYFHICVWMKMPLWVVGGVRLCSADPDIARSKEKSHLTFCPSREPGERAWEMYLLTHLLM